MRPNPHLSKNPMLTRLYRPGYVFDKGLTFQILPSSHLKPAEKAAVRAFIKPLLTGYQAEAIVYKEDPLSKKKGHEHGWAYKKMDLQGRVGVMSFRGMEVALFYKRQMTEIKPVPGEPIPENIIQEPTDVWVRFDLLGKSAREQNLFLAQRHSTYEESIKRMEEKVAAKDALIDAVEKSNKQMHRRIEVLTEQRDKMALTIQSRGAPKKSAKKKEPKNGSGVSKTKAKVTKKKFKSQRWTQGTR